MSFATPLENEHHSLGASFTDFAGWQMPLKYDSDLTEHHAVRSVAGLFDLSHMGEIDVTGPDAARFLDHALAGEFTAVTPGRAKYSLICNEDGGVIDDLVAYRLGADQFLVVANASNAGTVFAELTERATGFDVAVTDRSQTTALIALQGPAAESILLTLVPPAEAAAVQELKYYAATTATVAEIPVLLGRTGYTGEDGFELYVPNENAVDLWRALLEPTVRAGGVPAGLACRDSLRLEAGMALYGHELSLDITPFEAGLGRVVRLNKKFVGSQALQKIADTAPARTLVGLVGTGKRAARAQYAVHDAYDPNSVIGVVTSGILSPTLGYPIALAYLDSDRSRLGSTVLVDVRGGKLPFTVVKPPFYKRS